MQKHHLQYSVEKEQRSQQNLLLLATLVTVFAVVTSALAPQIIYQYFLQNASMEQQVAVLQYLPVVSYGLSALFFVIALVSQVVRGRRIRSYEQEMMLLSFTGECMCSDCGCHDDDMKDLKDALSAVEMDEDEDDDMEVVVAPARKSRVSSTRKNKKSTK